MGCEPLSLSEFLRILRVLQTIQTSSYFFAPLRYSKSLISVSLLFKEVHTDVHVQVIYNVTHTSLVEFVVVNIGCSIGTCTHLSKSDYAREGSA